MTRPKPLCVLQHLPIITLLTCPKPLCVLQMMCPKPLCVLQHLPITTLLTCPKPVCVLQHLPITTLLTCPKPLCVLQHLPITTLLTCPKPLCVLQHLPITTLLTCPKPLCVLQHLPITTLLTCPKPLCVLQMMCPELLCVLQCLPITAQLTSPEPLCVLQHLPITTQLTSPEPLCVLQHLPVTRAGPSGPPHSHLQQHWLPAGPDGAALPITPHHPAGRGGRERGGVRGQQLPLQPVTHLPPPHGHAPTRQPAVPGPAPAARAACALPTGAQQHQPDARSTLASGESGPHTLVEESVSVSECSESLCVTGRLPRTWFCACVCVVLVPSACVVSLLLSCHALRKLNCGWVFRSCFSVCGHVWYMMPSSCVVSLPLSCQAPRRLNLDECSGLVSVPVFVDMCGTWCHPHVLCLYLFLVKLREDLIWMSV